MTEPVDFPPFFLRRREIFVLHVKCYEKVVSALYSHTLYAFKRYVYYSSAVPSRSLAVLSLTKQ